MGTANGELIKGQRATMYEYNKAVEIVHKHRQRHKQVYHNIYQNIAHNLVIIKFSAVVKILLDLYGTAITPYITLI